MQLEVMCYSGFKGDERPVRFRLGGFDYRVEEILQQWYGPEDQFFRVRASDGKTYVLRRCGGPAEGVWRLGTGEPGG